MVDTPVAGATLSPNVTLSLPEIYSLLIANGASAAEALNLTAISTREDPTGALNIVNDNPSTGDYSVGLFQFNFLDANGNRMSSRNGYTPVQLANDVNAQIKSALELWRSSVTNGIPGSDWMPHENGTVLPWNTGVNMGAAVGAVAQVGGNVDTYVQQAEDAIASGGGYTGSAANQAGQNALNTITSTAQTALQAIHEAIGQAQLDPTLLNSLTTQITTDISGTQSWLQQFVQNGQISQAAADNIVSLIQQAQAANPNITTTQLQNFLSSVLADPSQLGQQLQALASGPGGVLVTTVTPGLSGAVTGAQTAAQGAQNLYTNATSVLGALNNLASVATYFENLGKNITDEVNKIKSGNFSDLSGAAVLIIGMSVIGIGGLLLLAEGSQNSQVQSVVKTGAKVAAM